MKSILVNVFEGRLLTSYFIAFFCSAQGRRLAVSFSKAAGDSEESLHTYFFPVGVLIN